MTGLNAWQHDDRADTSLDVDVDADYRSIVGEPDHTPADPALVAKLTAERTAYYDARHAFPAAAYRTDRAVERGEASVTCTAVELATVHAVLAAWRECQGRAAAIDAIRVVVTDALPIAPVLELPLRVRTARAA